MNLWERLNRIIAGLLGAFAAMGRVRLWIPFLVLLLVQGLLLGFVYFGVRPPLTDFFRGPLSFALPGQFFHYPQHLVVLPVAFYRFLIPVGLFLESLLLAAATLLFVRHFERAALPSTRAALREVKFGYPQYVLFWLVSFALLWTFQMLWTDAFGNLWIGYSRRRLLLEGLRLVGTAALNSLFIYSTVIIVLERTRVRATAWAALRTVGRHPLTTLFFVGLGTLVAFPPHFVMARAPEWIGKFNPEVILLILGAGAVLGVIASFLVAATVTFWYLVQRQPD